MDPSGHLFSTGELKSREGRVMRPQAETLQINWKVKTNRLIAGEGAATSVQASAHTRMRQGGLAPRTQQPAHARLWGDGLRENWPEDRHGRGLTSPSGLYLTRCTSTPRKPQTCTQTSRNGSNEQPSAPMPGGWWWAGLDQLLDACSAGWLVSQTLGWTLTLGGKTTTSIWRWGQEERAAGAVRVDSRGPGWAGGILETSPLTLPFALLPFCALSDLSDEQKLMTSFWCHLKSSSFRDSNLCPE